MQTTITWIATDVELPDDDIVVLVAMQSDSDPVWLGYLDGCDWYSVDGTRYTCDVTHWCELPQYP